MTKACLFMYLRVVDTDEPDEYSASSTNTDVTLYGNEESFKIKARV